MEDDFYASIKLISGEEIFAKVSVCEEDERTLLLLSNPVTLEEVKMKKWGTVGYKVEAWMKTASDDMFPSHDQCSLLLYGLESSSDSLTYC